MKHIVKLLVFSLFFAVCGAFSTHAQGWQDRARKEGADYLRQALGGSQQQKQKSASAKKNTQQPAKKRHRGGPQRVNRRSYGLLPTNRLPRFVNLPGP